MGARTRSSASNSPVKISSPMKSTGAHEESPPLKLFIIPRNSSSAARFLLLKHPREGTKKRFYFCPINGLFEFKKFDSNTTDPRSVLFTGSNTDSPSDVLEAPEHLKSWHKERVEDGSQKPTETIDVAGGYVNKGAEMFVATPFDLVFILIPLLGSLGSSSKQNVGKALFQQLDDVLDNCSEDDKHLRYILEEGRSMLECAAATICDTVEAGHERLFRLSQDKLFRTILDKAQNAIARGLPASMEEKFVRRALEKPILSIKREDASSSDTTEVSSIDNSGGSFGVGDSQCSTIASAGSAVASKASPATMIADNEDEAISDEIIRLQRLRTALSFITASYLPNALADRFTDLLSSKQGLVDFVPLEAYLSQLATLRADALASRALSGFGQKRGLEDEDASEVRAEKKRKQEEDEKRKKAGESRGVRDLKKVDVSGMKKMSAFFTKTSTTKIKS